MTARISVLDPSAPASGVAAQTHRTLSSLKGKVIGFVDNSKPNFNHLVDGISEVMKSRYGVKATVKHAKRLASIAASVDQMDDLVSRCDLVITGSGD
jgi:hypothetical protein